MTEPSPEERAAKVTEGLNGLQLAFTYTGPLSTTPPFDSLSVGKDGVHLFREAIAATIRDAVLRERERCALLAEEVEGQFWAEYKTGNGPGRPDQYTQGLSDGAGVVASRIREVAKPK